MVNRDTLSSYHPTVSFLYFACVLAFSMAYMHPVCLLISLVCALAYSISLRGRKAMRSALVFVLPIFLLAALLNPVFSHAGATILAYLPSGNPLTLESILYGIGAAAMLVAVITWFSCLNEVMTSDKLIYLFGRVAPALSLLLSMTLRAIPRFKTQLKLISNAQKCVGREASGGSIARRAKNGTAILSILVTWALENAIETADSMKSRGYGLKGRTAYSIYRLDRRDHTALIFQLACAAYILTGGAFGALSWQFYPTLRGGSVTLYSASVFLVYFALNAMPLAMNIREDRKWRALKSKI